MSAVKDRDFFAERGTDENATGILCSTEAISYLLPNRFHNKSLMDEQERFLKKLEIPDYTDYEAITRITNTLKNREKSVESFFEICVIRVREVLFQSTLYRGERR